MTRVAVIDPAGRPLEKRRQQALIAAGIVIAWIFTISFVFWATSEGPGLTPAPIPWLMAMGVLSWAAAEQVGTRKGLVWVASAFGIVGPLSFGFAASLLTPELRTAPPEQSLAAVAGTAAFFMALFLFRFRLPGLISPVVTFTVVTIFLAFRGTDPESLRRVEGFSPRGILAALLDQPLWAALVGALAFLAVVFARRMDLHGDDFGLATARPLHLIGAGIAALVFGRMLGTLPAPLDLVTLAATWIGAFLWAMRINRFGVVCTIHLAIAKPMLHSVLDPFGVWLSFREFSWAITAILVFNLAIWPWLHERSLRANWTLGPGGRIPRRRNGFWWRYWPYA